MFITKEIEQIYSESLDLSNLNTFRTVVSFTEAEQKNGIIILANKLYRMIIDKLENTDFREIEVSKGDITKLKQYKQIRDSIDVLTQIARESNSGIDEVNEMDKALYNIIKLKPIFTNGFKHNVEMIKYFYDSIVLALISDIGFMTTVCVEFFKNPNSTVSLEINNLQQYKSKFYLVHKNLIAFNTACDKGQIEKAFKVLNNNKMQGAKFEAVEINNYNEDFVDIAKSVGKIAIFIPAAIIGGVFFIIINTILPILRDLAYLFFSFRTHLSDWFAIQHDLLEANALRLKSLKSTSDKDYQEIAKSQLEWANRMGKIANMLAVEYIPAEKKALKKTAEDKVTTLSKDEVDDPNYHDSLF